MTLGGFKGFPIPLLKGRARPRGGRVSLRRARNATVAIAEGIENALSVAVCLREEPSFDPVYVWAAGAIANLAGLASAAGECRQGHAAGRQRRAG